MVRRAKYILLALMLLSLWGQAGQVFAASADGNFVIGCNGFSSQGATITLNRDNTGNNQEAFTVTAYDGFGSVLYSQTTTFIVGGGFVFPPGAYGNWTQQPATNPIILTISSNAGNGFAEQVIYRQSGTCEQIGFEGTFQPALVGLPDVAAVDGTTSPSVPIGEVPPTPAGINGIASLLDLPGFGVVNTARLNLRTGAGIQYTRIAILDGGTELIILGRNPAGTWWYVQVDTLRGWVNGQYVALRGNLQYTNIVPGQGEVEPARFILYNNYSLYNGPSAFSGTACVLPGNVEFVVIGRTATSEWFQIEATCGGSAVTGWVNGALGAVRTSGAVRIPVTG